MKFETSEVLLIVLATNVATHAVSYVDSIYVSIALAVVLWFGMSLLERRGIARRRQRLARLAERRDQQRPGR